MFNELSLCASINTESIALNTFVLNEKRLLVQKKCKRILMIHNQALTIVVNNVKLNIVNQICFIDGEIECELCSNDENIEIICLEFDIDLNIESLNKLSIIDINAEVKVFCLYIESLFRKKLCNPQILNLIISFFVMLNESINLKENDYTINSPSIINEIKSYLHKNIDSKVQIQDIADTFFISRSELFYLFKKYTNTTIIDYLNNLRIRKAKELLNSTNYSVTEISQLVGFDSLQYFSRVFKKSNGNSPREFRKFLI